MALGAALVQRARTGRGDVARSALAAAGNLIQAPFMYDHPGRVPFDEPAGRDVKGWGPFYYCYRAADQWMFFAAPTERERALLSVDELSDLVDAPEEAMREALSEQFACQTVAHWAAEFPGGSSSVVPLGSLHQTRDCALQHESVGDIDLYRDTFRAIRHDRHPMGRWVDLVAPNAVRPRRSTISIPGPAPKYGAYTRQILSELGYDTGHIQDMLDRRVAAESWSEKYLPE